VILPGEFFLIKAWFKLLRNILWSAVDKLAIQHGGDRGDDRGLYGSYRNCTTLKCTPVSLNTTLVSLNSIPVSVKVINFGP